MTLHSFLPRLNNIMIAWLLLEIHSVANLKLNGKNQFFLEEVVALGFKVSKYGINPNPAKVQEINDFKPPKNVSGVKQILGM